LEIIVQKPLDYIKLIATAVSVKILIFIPTYLISMLGYVVVLLNILELPLEIFEEFINELEFFN
jgi:hypothetical protein